MSTDSKKYNPKPYLLALVIPLLMAQMAQAEEGADEMPTVDLGELQVVATKTSSQGRLGE